MRLIAVILMALALAACATPCKKDPRPGPCPITPEPTR